ncbi:MULTISPECIES: IclR family transcriptional regulator [unclassified Bordetella]|uniref:IclR family transcriptional regulator n=1 Tax=unclassified Bordetella TaxID=2630031 RepID=UPI0013256C30|nr:MULTISPECIES: IclR family transcriptional regulator [unclassified Bordetella]MVW69923.1 helix-turn-helix domain-containing protein [Bordetella sp. 15P40C-2]MVW77532.1 helix-turn-helix domain-containing protein [Bordetella sp. 02P26C-1]
MQVPSELPPADPSNTSPALSGPARRRRGAGQGRAAPEFIEALARGLDVLRCFGKDTSTLGNQDLAGLTGLPKPTISRITYTLTELGYLRYHPESGKYSPGFAVLALGFGVLAGLEVRAMARDCMQQLAKDTGGAIALGTFDGDAMVYVEAIHGSSDLYLRLPVGYRASFNSAMGRAYLARLPASKRAELLNRLGQAAPAESVIQQACADFASTGCCFALGSWRSDINAVAVPFESVTGEGTFVVSCGGPASLLPPDVLRDRVVPALRKVAQQLSGYRP